MVVVVDDDGEVVSSVLAFIPFLRNVVLVEIVVVVVVVVTVVVAVAVAIRAVRRFRCVNVVGQKEDT